jgi:hypothetical protein
VSRPEGLSAWMSEVSNHMSHLSKPQLTVLALWSFSMALTRSCSLSAATVMVSALLKQSEETVRQRLREWYWDAKDKRGPQRREIVVESCFGPLLAWLMTKWQGEQVALALDATALGDKLVVLVVSVLYRGCAIPVAWKVLLANRPGGWKREWLRLLRLVRPGLPADKQVIVLSDRGISRPWLFRRICRLGWHPLLRITRQGSFRVQGQADFRSLPSFVPQQGARWSGRGRLYQTKRLRCTLLCRWEVGYDHPWLLITDLAPTEADPYWYSLRAWIEQGFKFTKRAGWQWHRTRMTDPERAARLWLVIAVATLWLLGVGGYAEQAAPETSLPQPSAPLDHHPAQAQPVTSPLTRSVSVFRRGWIQILVALITQQPLPKIAFIPEPWPEEPIVLDLSQSLINSYSYVT